MAYGVYIKDSFWGFLEMFEYENVARVGIFRESGGRIVSGRDLYSYFEVVVFVSIGW